MDRLLELGLPGLVFLGLCVWLVRKAAKAARTEGDLEGNRLEGALAEELQAARLRAGAAPPYLPPRTQPQPEPPPENLSRAPSPLPDPSPSPLSGADTTSANPEHLTLVASLVSDREALLRAQHPGATGRRIDVLWVRSNATHCAWCERRSAASPAASALARDVICVAQIDRGKVIERWFFG